MPEDNLQFHKGSFTIENVTFHLIYHEDFARHTPADSQNINFHSHKHTELFCVTRGTAEIVFSDHTESLAAQDWICIAPNVSHYSLPSDDAELYAFFCLFSSREKSELYRSMCCTFQTEPYRILRQNTFLASIYKRMASYYQNAEYPLTERLQLVTACFHELIFYVRYCLQKQDTEIPERNEDDKDLRQIRISQYIYTHYTEDLRLEEMSRIFFLSPHHINRIVKQMTGYPLRQYLILLRMQIAALMLSETDSTVKEIAAAAGYASLHGFYAAFKNTYGIPPEKYRNAGRLEAIVSFDENGQAD